MLNSMTAFASRTGSASGYQWHWDLRSVNGRGLDIRTRMPDSLTGIEAAMRKALAAAITRGNVQVSLRLTREEAASAALLDMSQLDRVLEALDQIQERAFAKGVTLGQPTAADVLAQRGVFSTVQQSDVPEEVGQAILADIPLLIADFVAMRQAEGAALARVISGQIDEIARLTKLAQSAADARHAQQKNTLQAALQRLLDEQSEVGPDRLAQELALIAVKTDIMEEIDRLAAHVSAAKALVTDAKPVGRKLDFLTQEFNREANTLCSKAQFAPLTAVGLDLKAVIDQMREQIQNVE